MTKYLILTEKPSAAKNFATALHGASGHFADFDYRIMNLRGHLLNFKEPDAMVAPELAKQYKSWKLKDMPWQLSDLNWQRTYVKQRGKGQTSKQLLDQIKAELQNGYDGVVIATDNDPSGEGDLLAFEALDAIKWRGAVYRANFMDETAPSIQKALKQLQPIADKWQFGPYLKGESRSRWDFASMQLTRIATTLAKEKGFKVVAREGRLKSVIIWKIYEQWQKIKAYVPKTFYEVKFKDPAGHVFLRKPAREQTDVPWRFEQQGLGQQDLASYQPSQIVNEQHTTKRMAPPRLLDLAGLAALLAPQGLSSKQVLSTYQKMYEAQYVSYPRTEDRNVTPEQFNELLPVIDKIAAVVGVDAHLLTHREPRKTHVKNQGSHGANRPGVKVPNDLAQLDKFGPGAQAIYRTLAKNYLAMLAEDYIYDHVTAELADYPDFKTSYNLPIQLNFKAIFNPQKDEETGIAGPLGPMAEPFLAEGVNPKPQTPTTKWIMAYLEKQEVGTGATRVSTLSEMSQGAKAMLAESKGKLTPTKTGDVSAIMVENTWIASPKITRRLFAMMDEVGNFQMPMSQLLQSVTQVIEHDLPQMQHNAEALVPKLGAAPKTRKVKAKPKAPQVTGTFNGEAVHFAKTWGEHTFTEQEITDLLAGKTITFETTTKQKKPFTAKGRLGKRTYRGNEYVGFKLVK
ncbi:DNA topoisomerase-3 [Weissella uvarum]|uniref:DNA topoisomerase n=1 Tax=Weissella uvarum TaxID=1479233 RepID=UPI001960E752|nr:DNA topoisomerase [Weissella uvarum]MBM7617973.1 DNA topoisomerase-3 [Weissella uvarum]MCM0596192.1 type IA DNA topoisomerase [Weissella uvarum]